MQLRTFSALDDIGIGARFLVGLPSVLRRPIAPEQARSVLRGRLARREADFLSLMQRAVYRQPASPYRELLLLAGCEQGDLERLVVGEGLEAALRTLVSQGVYLTVEEFKGRRPTIRGSARFDFESGQLHNPLAAEGVPAATGASRSAGTAVPMDFAHIRDRAVDTLLALEARGGADWAKAHWHVPGGGVLARLLEFSSFGSPVERWFSQVDPAAPGLHPRYRWSAIGLYWGSRLVGKKLPRPEYVPFEDPLPIVHWMHQTLRAGRAPHLFTFVSSAVRLSRAALEQGVDLRGAQLTVTGEPLTASRRAAVEQSGATIVPRYAITECGVLGFGCYSPKVSDDVHLPHDLHAVVQTDSRVPGPPGELPSGSLFITSLRPTAPIVLLNVSMGDQAELSERRCGCPLEPLGWTTHLQTIRSYEKLTAGGMTFLDVDVIQVLEELLPTRFGGGPTDYQLVEAESEDGRPDLRLLVHPDIGPLDEAAVANTFLQAIGSGTGVERVMALQWQQAGLPRVERRPPHTTQMGKILHLHVQRRPVAAAAQAS